MDGGPHPPHARLGRTPWRSTPQPLTQEAFAPFGDVIDVPSEPGRKYYEDALGNLRAERASASLSMSLKAETPDRPLKADMLERHEFSSQTFMPIDVGRWLIVVAPHAAAGRPRPRRSRWPSSPTASRASPTSANTWHHGLTTLDKPGRFAVFMWRDGGKGDEEFVPGRALHHPHSLIRRACACHTSRAAISWAMAPTCPIRNGPNGARLAVNFVMNYEEGSEPSIQDGEDHSDTGLTEAHGMGQTIKGRDLAAESLFEYGSRVGFWRADAAVRANASCR